MADITIRDIARMAGVSPAAVSFVINDRPGVSAETRLKVRKVIEKTGFVPNMNSRRLVYKRSFNIALVMNNERTPLEDLFYVGITRGLLRRSKEYGYNIVFTEIDIVNNEVLMPQMMRQHDTDGVIFLQGLDDAILRATDKLAIPYVVVDAHEKNVPYTCVYVDYELSAYTSTSYLIENGHRQIAFISKSSVPHFYIQTFKGFCRALDNKGISIPPDWMQITAYDEDSAYECMKNIMNSKSLPTAVFCSVDSFAIGAMRCVKDMGYRVPDDISFTGIDNIFLSNYFEPGLTTVNIDKEQLGMLAMDLIVKKIEGEEVESAYVPSDELVIRNSVKRIV
jgi:LacI family transcriptional regulator